MRTEYLKTTERKSFSFFVDFVLDFRNQTFQTSLNPTLLTGLALKIPSLGTEFRTYVSVVFPCLFVDLVDRQGLFKG